MKNNSKVGEPINTSDILEQLKKLKENMEKEIQNKESSKEEQNQKLKEESTEYTINKDEKADEILNKTGEYLEGAESEERKAERTKESVDENVEIETEINLDTANQAESTDSEQTVENKEEQIKEMDLKTEEIIEKIENPEIKQEFKEIKEKMQKLNDNPQVVTDDFNEMYTKLFGNPPIQETKEEDKNTNANDIINSNVSMFDEIEEYKKPNYKFIGIVFKTYIILEIDQEMYILDQHAAHERIMYEKVKKNYYSETSKDSQMLLLPDVITLTHKEMDIAKENMQMFEKAGFSLEEFGENTIKLTGVPTVCIDLDNKELFLETLDEINTVARTAKQEKEEKFIATVACKAQ